MRKRSKKVSEPVFTVKQLTESKKYHKYADILNALFEPTVPLTGSEADRAIKQYLERSI